jgi:hypothetical protein
LSKPRDQMDPVNRQEEALRVAEELLTDIELERLKASEVVLKASRIARLVGHEDLTTFLGHERVGYPTDGTTTEWIGRAGRWSGDEDKFYPVSISKMEATLDAENQAVTAMQGGGNYSGDHITIASREHDNRIAGHARNAGDHVGHMRPSGRHGLRHGGTDLPRTPLQ